MDDDKRVKYSLFLDNSGRPKREVLEKYPALSADLALAKAMADALPNRIRMPNPDISLSAIREWMKENVHDGWNVLVLGGETTLVFARDVDAINFKMAWT